ncbi:ABC transporter permease/substrate-binding protein [Lacticaseibacillus camelliae]|uniref:ABC transporter permease n=1 Tax=Lacticaseibacillus camelliae DSM 22697 = JCM 13995 TaxID=1423730 RepID=A0A0R2FER9_9LACO|nr:ABC transporter permease/substrate-binding protein [Lacticaseibacillus camelliae]KRN25883.1 ABC transporter permease [Lacticaseibacillus camelliae DSM 22697 = JCM 13995]
MQALWETFLNQRETLLTKLVEHLQLSLVALLLALLIAIPLGIWAQNHDRFAGFLLQVTGILQTIPSLALLGLLIPIVGIGTTPSIIALVVYALLPIFQNTYTGLHEIDPAYKEAEEAFGMSKPQRLVKVELPLAMPVILGGVRTAAVLIIGTATLAALVGGGGLGDIIMRGINLNDPTLTLLGALASALLAILFSWFISMISKWRWQVSVTVIGALVLGFGGYATYQAVAPKPETITVAGKLGSEPEILINMYKDLIEQADANVKVELKPNFGQTSFLYSALKSDKIDIYPEFTGTVVSSLLKPSAKQSAQIAAGRDPYPIAESLLSKQGLRLGKPMAYNNTYAVVVKKAWAQQNGITKISDLTKLSKPLKAGFDVEFNARDDGYKGIQSKYGVNFTVNTLDSSMRYQALNRGQVQVTDGYSTDSQIRQYHLLALQDDRQLFPVYQGAPLMRTQFAKTHPKLTAALNKLGGKISEADMQEMNYEVNVQGKSASAVAKAYLIKHGLLKEAR